MLRVCRNFCNILSVCQYSVLVVNYELMGLRLKDSQAHRYSKLLYSTNNPIRYTALKTLLCNNDNLCDDIFVMAKHKKSAHHLKHKKNSSKTRENERKVHKHHKKSSHSRSSKKEKSSSHRSRKDSVNKSKRVKSKLKNKSIIEVFLSDSSGCADDITIVFDSKQERLNKTTKKFVFNDAVQSDRPCSEFQNEREGDTSVCQSSINEGRSEVGDMPCDAVVEEEVHESKRCSSDAVIEEEVHQSKICSSDAVVEEEVHQSKRCSSDAVVEEEVHQRKRCSSGAVVEEEVHQSKRCSIDAIDSTHPHVDQASFVETNEGTSRIHKESGSCESSENNSSDRVHHGSSRKSRASKKKKGYKSKREWEHIAMGSDTTSEGARSSSPHHLIFSVLSYNVLSQSIMEDHPDLYKDHNPQALEWEYRSELLMKEFEEFSSEILCLQEVQQTHLETFYSRLHNLGYSGIYKQRTGNKVDGVAIYYKKNVFNLIDYTTVEYFQPGIELMNRDNVGLVAKLAPKVNPDIRIVVATTHLLFNPRRHDIKLAQVQILLAEVERFAFKGFDLRTGRALYWPVIVTGDMNFEPQTGVYQLMTMGSFQYEGLNKKTLHSDYGYVPTLGKELLPRELDVTDTCQHWSVLIQRRMQVLDHTSERHLLKIYNGDYVKRTTDDDSRCQLEALNFWAEIVEDVKQTQNPVHFMGMPLVTPGNMSQIAFGSGQLSHCLNLKSAYNHDPDNFHSSSQVSTHQGRWVAVDYIFYSSLWVPHMQLEVEDNLKLLARYKMFSEAEAKRIGPIPNLISPSDHYPLCAKFALRLQ